MSAPNRAAEVKAIFDTLTIYPKTEQDEGRRGNLYEIGRQLNAIDGGNWGVLCKTDQNDKVPADILVWRPTMEHFDVITGDGGAFWKPWGPVANPAWVWRAIPSAAPQEPPAPDPEPPSEPKPAEPEPDLEARILALEQRITALEEKPEPPPIPVATWAPVTLRTSREGWHAHTITVEQPQG